MRKACNGDEDLPLTSEQEQFFKTKCLKYSRFLLDDDFEDECKFLLRTYRCYGITDNLFDKLYAKMKQTIIKSNFPVSKKVKVAIMRTVMIKVSKLREEVVV